VALISIAAWAITSYVLIALVPGSNQRFLEIVFNLASERAEGDVKPRIFFDEFSDFVVYVRDIAPSGGWQGVFLADRRADQDLAVYVAERGRLRIDREKKTIDMELFDATRHSSDPNGEYQTLKIGYARFTVDPAAMFAELVGKNARQMSIAELRAQIEENQKTIDPATNGPYSTHNERMEIQKRFSIPVACLVFGLIGLALGATHRRDGALGSFVIGVVVVFAYYVPLMLGPSLVKGRYLAPWLGMWLPNFILGALGIIMFIWRDRLADRPFSFRLPAWLHGIRRPRGRSLPGLTTLDSYITAAYLRYVVLSAVTLLSIFYIASFLDLSDKVFKGTTSWLTLVEYFRYATPEWLYYILPLGVLLGTLVTIAVLTKNSELIVMKACGISLYRLAAPMLVSSVIVGGALFLMQESILGPSTRRADEVKSVMKGGDPRSFNILSNRWLVGSEGEIYHYQALNPRTRTLTGLEVYEFTPRMEQFARRSFMESATFADDGEGEMWDVTRGWTRNFDAEGDVATMAAFDSTRRALESADYFGAEEPIPRYMGYRQLRDYTNVLREGGFDVLSQEVELARKLAFPVVTLIMALLAVPFAATIGRSGAMGGIAIGIALAISYWALISLFAALGKGGALPPLLAAWAPNMLFGAGAVYLLLTVRT
jgi:LPS export ABC transporter permease LptG